MVVVVVVVAVVVVIIFIIFVLMMDPFVNVVVVGAAFTDAALRV